MTIERTFSIIKPDATERNLIGEICAMLEKSGLKIIASRRTRMTPEKAAQFYSVHSERPFFQSLCDFMCLCPCAVVALRICEIVSLWHCADVPLVLGRP